MAELTAHLIPLAGSNVVLDLPLHLGGEQVAVPVPIQRVQQGDLAGRRLDDEGVLRLPAVVQTIAIGVPEIRVGSKLHLLSIGQTIPVGISEGAVVGIGEGLILLPCLLFVVRRRERNLAEVRLAVIEWVQPIGNLPSVIEPVIIGVSVPPVCAIQGLLHPVRQPVAVEIFSTDVSVFAGFDIACGILKAAGLCSRKAGVNDCVETRET